MSGETIPRGVVEELLAQATREGFEMGWAHAHEGFAEWLQTQGASAAACKGIAATPCPDAIVMVRRVESPPEVPVPGTKPPREPGTDGPGRSGPPPEP